jgi:predicted membrane protein
MTPSRKLFTPQIIIGIGVMTIGVVFLLDNLGHPIARGALAYWPVVLIAIGAGKLLQAGSVGEAIGGSIWGLVGAWILLNNLGVIDLTFFRALRLFWPLIIVAVGVSIVWRAVRGRGCQVSETDSRDFLDVTAIVGGVKRVSAATNLKAADATAFMGGVHLDLRKAIVQKEAVVDIFVMWGGIELTIPENWVVDLRVTPLFGGADDKTRPVADPNAPRLLITGTIIFGGLEIKN